MTTTMTTTTHVDDVWDDADHGRDCDYDDLWPTVKNLPPRKTWNEDFTDNAFDVPEKRQGETWDMIIKTGCDCQNFSWIE